MLNRIVLSLGSNEDRERNMVEAGRMLSEAFISVCFSEPVYTNPVGINVPGPFLNQVAVAFTAEEPVGIRCRLKQIEHQLHRTPEGKATGIIPIDIDLLQWNDVVLKSEDLSRDYIIEGIRFLKMKETDDFKQ